MNLNERRWVMEKLLKWKRIEANFYECPETVVECYSIDDGDFSEKTLTGPLLFALCRIARERCIRVRLEDWRGYSDDGHNGNIEVYLYDNNNGNETTFDNNTLNLALIAAARKILEDK